MGKKLYDKLFMTFVVYVVMLMSIISCGVFSEVKEMPIPKNLDQASHQVRSVIVGLRKVNTQMLTMKRYGSKKGQAVKEFLDCAKGHMNSLLWYKGAVSEPEKLLEAQNMLNLLLLIETRKFGGSHEVGKSCRLSG